MSLWDYIPITTAPINGAAWSDAIVANIDTGDLGKDNGLYGPPAPSTSNPLYGPFLPSQTNPSDSPLIGGGSGSAAASSDLVGIGVIALFFILLIAIFK